MCVCVSVCVCVCECVCVRSRSVCEAESCVRRARHVIQRNPPPETRGSEGDSIGYKASANICPEQCKADENISSELAQDRSPIYFISLGFIIVGTNRVGAPRETHLFSALYVNVTPQPSLYWN